MIVPYFYITLTDKACEQKGPRTKGKKYLVVDSDPTTQKFLFANDDNEFDWVNQHECRFHSINDIGSVPNKTQDNSGIIENLAAMKKKIEQLEQLINKPKPIINEVPSGKSIQTKG